MTRWGSRRERHARSFFFETQRAIQPLNGCCCGDSSRHSGTPCSGSTERRGIVRFPFFTCGAPSWHSGTPCSGSSERLRFFDVQFIV